MKNVLLALSSLALAATFSVANAQHSGKEVKEDVQRHRAMAAAHEAAAKCLESGKKEEMCMKDLQASCKGLAVGKYCGMKHAH
ncbi:MAG TPA: hypothetical protein VE934_11745 [Polaromonas sp.]|uniref:hypothetical protein n=1 Tax=Polaromonas sp. TaxID=1869339 RepID=UPI002D5275BA|nr:hypothetical protein [Polaromonas sp.]HYW57628.1 hypothetical protein [Polaromonas sp.]